jgi:para-aminobenzoate synthetase component 1
VHKSHARYPARVHSVALPDALDAEQAALRLAHEPGLCWLDGDAAHADGRYAFVAAGPVARVRVTWPSADPLAALAQLELAAQARSGATEAAVLLPEQVPRWIGYIAYDAALAPASARMSRPHGRPVLDFARYGAVAAFDLVEKRGFVLGDDRAACEQLAEKLAQPARPLERARLGAIELAPDALHLDAIERALTHIAAGDLYQVNLARELRARFSGSALELFIALRRASPVPLGFYYDDGARTVAARTMERFVRWHRSSRALHTRPIKGTRASGTDPARPSASSAHMKDELINDAKERAEHAMIVDLMRNDLSRVAEVGSVSVAELFTVEAYARLLHLVSTVRCTTRPEVTLQDVLRATFPPGSVTGAPKLAAVELIEALEHAPRDVYTGALGFVDRGGGLSLAVAIRTAIVDRADEQLRYFAGGGIVEASQPARELAETVLKAQVLLDARAQLG